MTAAEYRPIRRPSDMWPPPLLTEMRRLASLPELPASIEVDYGDDKNRFKCSPNVDSFYFDCCDSGADYAGLLATVCWLKEGPKIVNVTEEQYQALACIEVRLEVKDFTMPYPTLLVNMPPGKMHRYVVLHSCSVVAQKGSDMVVVPVLIGTSISYDNTSDIVTVVRQSTGNMVEESLDRFYGTVTIEEAEATHASMRVAANMALAMTGYGCQARYLFPAEVAQERKYIAKGDRAGRDGRTASMRLAEQPQILFLDREVKLWRREGSHDACQPTGREMPFHWRRGHWHMVRCGKGGMERNRVMYPPTMVRADLLGELDASDTTTSYRR